MALQDEKKRRIAREVIRIVHEVDEGMRMGVRYYRAAANAAINLTGPDKVAKEAEATEFLKRAARLPYRVESRIQNLISVGGWSVAQINNALALVSTETVAGLQAHLAGLKAYSDTLKDNFQNQGWTEAQIASDIEANRPEVDPFESVPLPTDYIDDFLKMPTIVFGDNTGDDYAGCDDAYLSEDNATTNYESSSVLKCYTTASSVQQFPIIQWIDNPPNLYGDVTAASIGIYNNTGSTVPTGAFRSISRIWVPSEVTWNQWKSGSNWSTGGATGSGDINLNDSTGSLVGTNGYATATMNATGYAQCEYLIAGEPNAGWVYNKAGTNAVLDLESNEAIDGRRPYLSVRYTDLTTYPSTQYSSPFPTLAGYVAADSGGNTAQSLTIPRPGGIEVDDLLIIFLASDESQSTANGWSSTHTGWTLVRERFATNRDVHVQCWARVADGTESIDEVFSHGTADELLGIYMRIANADPTVTLDEDYFFDAVNSLIQFDGMGANFSTTADDCLIIAFAGFDGGDWAPGSYSGGTSGEYDNLTSFTSGTGGNDVCGFFVTRDQATAGQLPGSPDGRISGSVSDGYMGIAIGIAPAAAGDIDGTIPVAFTQTADLKGTGALAGTATIGFTETADLIGRGTIAATEAIAFGETGAINGKGDLAATEAIAFSETGAITGKGELLAEFSPEFILMDQAGTLTGRGDLTGTSAVLFDSNADLSAADGDIDGTATIITGETADLKGGGVLAATEAIAFSETGAITGKGDLAATEAIAFTETATLAASGALAGTEAILFGHVADLKGGGALSGTVAAVFGDTATLIGQGELQGAESITFADTANLNGFGPLAGNVAIIYFDNNFGEATLTGEGALDGTSSIVFNETADLKGAGVLTGTAATVFGDAASLTGAGLLAGVTTVIFGETVTLTGNGDLAGQSDIVFDSVANLLDADGGQISGTADLVFADVAALTGKGDLAGQSDIVFDDTVSLNTFNPIDATVNVVFTDNSTLAGKGDLAGSSPIVFAETGALTAQGALDGTVPVIFSETGNLNGVGALAATEAITFTEIGAVTGKGALAATEAIVFSETGAITAQGALAGTEAITFTETADLKGAGVLAGTIPITFDTDSTLFDSSGSSISGTANLTFGDSTTLVGEGALVGSLPITFGDAANLNVFSPIDGTIATLFADNTALTAKGDLAAIANIFFGTAATMTGIGSLAGTLTAVFDDNAALFDSGNDNIDGTATIIFAESADLKGGAALSGSTAILFDSIADLISGGLATPSGRVIPVQAKAKGLAVERCKTGKTINVQEKDRNR